MKMIGQRSEDFVVLSGGPWAIFVEKDHCLLLSRKGQQVGKLARINRVSPTWVHLLRKTPPFFLMAPTLITLPPRRSLKTDC